MDNGCFNYDLFLVLPEELAGRVLYYSSVADQAERSRDSPPWEQSQGIVASGQVIDFLEMDTAGLAVQRAWSLGLAFLPHVWQQSHALGGVWESRSKEWASVWGQQTSPSPPCAGCPEQCWGRWGC